MIHASIFKGRRRRVFLLWLYLLLAAAAAFSSAAEIDCNTCCRFPLSLGVEYQRLSPFAAYGSRYHISDLSAAMQSCCVGQPVGTVAITNTEKNPMNEVVVAFMQPGCMDSPTRAASLAELKAGETKKIELFASFNQEVFCTEGVTP